MPSKKLSKPLYQTLLNDIAAIYDGAMKEMGVAVDGILKKAYWEIGERIVEVEQKGDLHAEYGSHLLEELSKDLTRMNRKGFSERNLLNMRRVYLAFSIPQTSAELTWSHYVLLSSIPDEKDRQAYAKKATKEKWDVRELKRILQEEKIVLESMDSDEEKSIDVSKKDTKDIKVPRLALKRGILHTYRIIEPLDPSVASDKIWIDCGFFIYREMKKPQGVDLNPGDGVTAFERNTPARHSERSPQGEVKNPIGEEILRSAISLPQDDGNGIEHPLGYTLKPFDAKDLPLKLVLYTYAAEVVKVIDADTITVVVHLGFGLFSKQKLRLRKINAPELSTPKGKKAREFVVERLKSCPLVVIKTYSTDIFDRFLADVFYLPDCDDAERITQEGILLNQELIDEGLADLWQTVDPNELAFLN